tara:strand:- start:97 stop:327 length:231 start_codon:yes stop_codon:yes gene_type:complete
MKGVKYNIKLKEEKNQFREYRELTMKDAIKKIKDHFISHYDYEPKVSNHTIFNLQNRPQYVNGFLKSVCEVVKVGG